MVQKFKIGDVVRLKSGGPDMTILHYEVIRDIASVIYGRPAQPDQPSDVAYCQWFAGKKLTGAKFNQELLELVNAERTITAF